MHICFIKSVVCRYFRRLKRKTSQTERDRSDGHNVHLICFMKAMISGYFRRLKRIDYEIERYELDRGVRTLKFEMSLRIANHQTVYNLNSFNIYELKKKCKKLRMKCKQQGF